MSSSTKKLNNFDALRIAAAVLVLFSHVPPLHHGVAIYGYLGAVGVFTFFALSGYLVAASWDRDPNVLRFLARRGLRVFPGLAVVLVVGALVVGPWLSSLSLSSYFRNPETYRYLQSIFLWPVRQELPGVFTENPFPRTVNGSLWTLPMEVVCYLLLCTLAVAVARVRGSLTWVASALIAACLLVEARGAEGSFLHLDVREFSRVAACFFQGVLFYCLRDRIRWYPWVWLIAAVVIHQSLRFPAHVWAILLLVPYSAIAFGRSCTPWVCRAGRWGDPSYGIYIYAFLLQQTVIALYPSMDQRLYFLITLALAVLAGYCSWHGVEKRFLKWKPSPRGIGTTTRTNSTAKASGAA